MVTFVVISCWTGQKSQNNIGLEFDDEGVPTKIESIFFSFIKKNKKMMRKIFISVNSKTQSKKKTTESWNSSLTKTDFSSVATRS